MTTNHDPIVPQMSEQQRATLPTRRRFSEEFKADAVRLVTEHGYTHKAAAAAIGLSDNTLSGWVRAARVDPPPCDPDASVEDLPAEVKRLRRQLAQAELEREILKKLGRRTSRRSRREVPLDRPTSPAVPDAYDVPRA